MNTFGRFFRITTFGESHGYGVGVVIDGCPPGLPISEQVIQKELARRKPGQSKIASPRNEHDEVLILSGIFEKMTTGMPITLLIKNNDVKSKDYDHLKNSFRPSHADYTYMKKYKIRDHRGGGRSSARETATWVAAGAIARLFISQYQITTHAYVSQVGKIRMNTHYQQVDFNMIDQNIVRCPDQLVAKEMISYIEEIQKKGDTVGGIITGVIQNCPVGIGEPIFDKLHANLGKAMLTINAVKGFSYGSGFDSAAMTGSAHNDAFYVDGDKNIRTTTNHSGGIQGGISNGEDIYFQVAFKPVATVLQTQQTISENLDEVEIPGRGRHDPCVVPRAVPIVEAMSNLVIADMLLASQSNGILKNEVA